MRQCGAETGVGCIGVDMVPMMPLRHVFILRNVSIVLTLAPANC
jgi:hypothetical protein